MLPSWIKSRNCKPRLVYFLAIEMTKRKFASTISFLARRALASPTDMLRATTFIWSMFIPRFCSCCWIRPWYCNTSSSTRSNVSAKAGLPAIRLGSQSRLVSLCGKVLRNSSFGILPRRITSFMMWRSFLRTSSYTSRIISMILSETRLLSLNSIKQLASSFIAALTTSLSRSWVANKSLTLVNNCSNSSKRRRTSSGSRPLASSVSASSLTPPSTSSISSAFSASSSSSSLASSSLTLGLIIGNAISTSSSSASAMTSAASGSRKPVIISETFFSPSKVWWYSLMSMATVPGQKVMACCTSRIPSSIRLAIAISPSRVSRSTVPISRIYIRTGSVVRPGSDSTEASTAAASSTAISSSSASSLSIMSSSSGAVSKILMPTSVSIWIISSIWSLSVTDSGSWSLISA